MSRAGRRSSVEFVTRARLGDALDPVPADDVARHLILGAWRILGGLDAALATAAEDGQGAQAVRPSSRGVSVGALRGRRRRGRTSRTERVGEVHDLATRDGVAGSGAADAIALRLHADEVAVRVLRCCHRLFGGHRVSMTRTCWCSIAPAAAAAAAHSAEAFASGWLGGVSRQELESLFTSA